LFSFVATTFFFVFFWRDMPKTWNQIPLTDLKYVADTLASAAAKLHAACKAFDDAGIQMPWTPWTDEVPRRTAMLSTFADDTSSEVNDQITSKRFKIKCAVEVKKERSAKELERRNKLKAALDMAFNSRRRSRLLSTP
jgi:hypothetical protein